MTDIVDNRDVIARVVDDLREVLQSIARINGNVIPVLSTEELLDKSKMVAGPSAGLIYEGMRAVGEQGKDTNRLGTSAEAMFTILILAGGKNLNSPEIKTSNLKLLGQLRKELRDRKSPSGHKYRFMLETPEDDKGGMILWGQRWAVPIPVI